jgi:peptide/nickel transport system permease protein
VKPGKAVIAAGVVLAFLHLIALIPGFLAPYPYTEQHRDSAFQPPARIHFIDVAGKVHLRPFIYSATMQNRQSIYFLVHSYEYSFFGMTSDRHLFGAKNGVRIFVLGTDALGRDQFSRLIDGTRISLGAAWIATLLSLGLGITLGTIAGFFGGLVDDLVMRMVEVSLSLPWFYLLLGARAFLPLNLPPAAGYFIVIGVIGILGWAQPARLIRGVSLEARQRGYVAAAASFGASSAYLIRVHVLPDTLNVAAIQAALLMPRYIIAELTLSFLGLGLDEPLPSWGKMLSGVQQYSILTSSWWMLLPAVGPAVIALCCFTISDALLARRRFVPV